MVSNYIYEIWMNQIKRSVISTKSHGSKDVQAHLNTKTLPEKNNDLLELLLTSRMI